MQCPCIVTNATSINFVRLLEEFSIGHDGGNYISCHLQFEKQRRIENTVQKNASIALFLCGPVEVSSEFRYNMIYYVVTFTINLLLDRCCKLYLEIYILCQRHYALCSFWCTSNTQTRSRIYDQCLHRLDYMFVNLCSQVVRHAQGQLQTPQSQQITNTSQAIQVLHTFLFCLSPMLTISLFRARPLSLSSSTFYPSIPFLVGL